MITVIETLAAEVNALALGQPIGGLQELRMRMRGKSRMPTRSIFDRRTTFPEFAFHVGGRAEIQFNIGSEELDSQSIVRFGLSFSLERSQSLPDVSVLFQKIRRFNEYVRTYRDELSDLFMWHYFAGVRSTIQQPAEVLDELARPGVFIFMGAFASADLVQASDIVALFNRLLPVYEFVESREASYPLGKTGLKSFEFKSGASLPQAMSSRSLAQRVIDVQLRHGDIARALIERLALELGDDNVKYEVCNGPRRQIDVVGKKGPDYWFYEIKTSLTARGCIREALPQLMEYAYWPGVQTASRLIVVGEPALDVESGEYLQLLRSRFGIPIVYEQVAIP